MPRILRRFWILRERRRCQMRRSPEMLRVRVRVRRLHRRRPSLRLGMKVHTYHIMPRKLEDAK